jgi:S-adenosylmethionine:tRNA ribosyltransferase-isomerase
VYASDFDFDLPPHLIAQEPRPRGTSRLLVVDRSKGSWHETTVAALPTLLAPGDLLVVNDTKVFPARLVGRRDPSGGAAECLLIEQMDQRDEQMDQRDEQMDQRDEQMDQVNGQIDVQHWHALVHPGQKLKPGARLVFDDPVRAPGVVLRAEILERRFFGRRLVKLSVEGATSVEPAIDALGHVPLPPYIRRPDEPADRERYQTVFARHRGSIAAPTAGLHFDRALLEALERAGIARTSITLHVGYGTFKPVRTERVEDHHVDAERYEISAGARSAVETTRAAGRRVVAVGTSSARALESAAEPSGRVRSGRAATELFIVPGYTFRVVDALLTNFHLPRSSLLMLVAAFAGRDLVLAAYRDAIARGYRFYSYGDAMLIV